MNFEQIVSILNQELYEKVEDSCHMFGYYTTGYVDVITFGEIVLWNSDDDTREWIEDDKDYEPFIPFIMKLFNEWVDSINLLKFEL